jgi:hypothetical protein
MNYVCLLHEGRCGSTVLASLLDSHPNIVSFGEILTPGSYLSDDFHNSPLLLKRDAREIGIALLPHFITNLIHDQRVKSKPCCTHILFEIKFNQIGAFWLNSSLTELIDILESDLTNVTFIFLTRLNLLRRHISTLRCIYQDISHKDHSSAMVQLKQRLSPDLLADYSYDFTELYTSISALMNAMEINQRDALAVAAKRGDYRICYEQFERNPLEQGMWPICDQLGLPRIQAFSPWIKTGDMPLSDLIENFDEIRKELESTRWAWMLD